MAQTKRRQRIRHGIILVSFFLFPATFIYFSPAVIISALKNSTISGSFITFVMMFLFAMVFGRAWCGWLCPGAGCLEALERVNNRPVTKGNWIKWAIWGPWLMALAGLAATSPGGWRIDPLFGTTHGLSAASVPHLIVYLSIILLLITLPGILVGKRSFCHHLCWMAPFMILGRKARNLGGWPALQLTADPQKCKSCHACDKGCSMSLPVEEMVKSKRMEHHECILCANCVDQCRSEAITIGFGSHAD